MKVYKRTVFSLLVSIIIAPFGGLAAWFIVGIFIKIAAVYYAAGILAFAALLYMAIFSENVYVELDDDGNFRYYKRAALLEEYKISECRVGYRRKSDRSFPVSHDIKLQIIDKNEEEHFIDCSPLGLTQFTELFDELKKLAKEEVEVLSANKEET
jgi:hypothetical protein